MTLWWFIPISEKKLIQFFGSEFKLIFLKESSQKELTLLGTWPKFKKMLKTNELNEWKCSIMKTNNQRKTSICEHNTIITLLLKLYHKLLHIRFHWIVHDE